MNSCYQMSVGRYSKSSNLNVARTSSFRLRCPLLKKARGRPEITTARIRCECQRRAPAAASTAAEGPEPEPERQPQGYSLPVLLLWARLVRRARRLKRLRRIWATIGNYLREVKERGREE